MGNASIWTATQRVFCGIEPGDDICNSYSCRGVVVHLKLSQISACDVMWAADVTDPAERQRRFVQLWTLKEAYVKAVGRGISAHPGLKVHHLSQQQPSLHQYKRIDFILYSTFYTLFPCALSNVQNVEGTGGSTEYNVYVLWGEP